MESTENKIEKNIKCQRKGKLLFASDFALCGNAEAIFKALQRLHKSGLRVYDKIPIKQKKNYIISLISCKKGKRVLYLQKKSK